MTKITHFYDHCGYGVYQLESTQIEDDRHYVLASGLIPTKEIELLMQGERTLSSAVLENLEQLEIIYKINSSL